MNDFKLDNRQEIKSGFKAPESYFESLSDRIMLNLPVQETKVIPLYKRKPVWITSAAAALVLSFTLVLSKNEASAPAIPDSVVTEDYLVNNLSQYEIQEELSQKDLSELTRKVNISDEAIEEYVLDQQIQVY